MTIAEANRFYEQDKKKYEIKKNTELNNWLEEISIEGYQQFIEVESLQELIDSLVKWYEIKYPENEMRFYEGIRYIGLEDVKPLSKYMDIKQLMFRLSLDQLALLECYYRSNGGYIREVRDDKKYVIGYEPCVAIPVRKKDNIFDFRIYAVASTGKILDSVYDEDFSCNGIDNLENLYTESFDEKYKFKYDFSKLELCIFEHSCDMELRRRILQLAALKMMYSENTIPERGYERAKRFINEFNKKLNLELTTEEIDEIMSRDYTIDPILDFSKDNVKKRRLSLFKK